MAKNVVLHAGLAFLAILLLLPMTAKAVQEPTQQFNSIYLSPFYVNSMTQNTDYNYAVLVDPPDGISSVKSAVLSWDIWMTPSRNFTVKVNNKNCNTQFYYISTTYASSGLARIKFDCTNVITKAGLYNITFTISGGNTGSSTAWLELTYMNSPKSKLSIFGTEYMIGDFGKLWLQLINSTGQEVDNAVCFLDVYDPDGIKYIDSATMSHLEKGIYYYDFIVPIYTGVYPAIAKCYYTVSQQTETADRGTIWIGTNNANSYTATQALDAVYWKIDEALSGGKYRIDYVLNFTGITSPSLVNSVTIDWWGKWNGQINDNLIFYIWNFTSNSWVQLPNQVANTGGSRIEVTNTITTSNLTQSGLLNNGQMVIRINDANATDATKSRAENDYLAIKINYFSSPEWQEVKGASEAHVSGDGSNLVYISTNCGDATSNCGVFTNDNEFDMREGEVEDNITVYSLTNKDDVDTEWAYTTPFSVDCSALYWIKFWNGTGWEDITDNVSLSSEMEKENCVIKVPITLNPNGITQSEYYYRIKYDNYMKWEVDWSKDLLDSLNSTLWADCENYGQAYNYTYEVPITESTNLSSISTLLSCHRILDDLYWFYRFYNDSAGISTTGEYLSYLYEARFYRQEIFRSLGIPNYFVNKGTYNLLNYTSENVMSILEGQADMLGNLSSMANYLVEINGTVYQVNATISQIVSQLMMLNSTMHGRFDQLESLLGQYNSSVWSAIQGSNASIMGYLAGMNSSHATFENDTASRLNLILSMIESHNNTIIQMLNDLGLNVTGYYNSLSALVSNINITENATFQNETLWRLAVIADSLEQHNTTIMAMLNQLGTNLTSYYSSLTSLLNAHNVSITELIDALNQSQNGNYASLASLVSSHNMSMTQLMLAINSSNAQYFNDITSQLNSLSAYLDAHNTSIYGLLVAMNGSCYNNTQAILNYIGQHNMSIVGLLNAMNSSMYAYYSDIISKLLNVSNITANITVNMDDLYRRVRNIVFTESEPIRSETKRIVAAGFIPPVRAQGLDIANATCIDNITLRQFWTEYTTISDSVSTDFLNITRHNDIICAWGCDNESVPPTCRASPFSNTLYFFLFILLMVGIVTGLYMKYGR